MGKRRPLGENQYGAPFSDDATWFLGPGEEGGLTLTRIFSSFIDIGLYPQVALT